MLTLDVSELLRLLEVEADEEADSTSSEEGAERWDEPDEADESDEAEDEAGEMESGSDETELTSGVLRTGGAGEDGDAVRPTKVGESVRWCS